jgi:hypothetical protein
MKTFPFYRLPRGTVFRFIKTGDILAKVWDEHVLVCDPCKTFEDDFGKIEKVVPDDMFAPCAIVNLRKSFYKQQLDPTPSPQRKTKKRRGRGTKGGDMSGRGTLENIYTLHGEKFSREDLTEDDCQGIVLELVKLRMKNREATPIGEVVKLVDGWGKG